jgi:hypothetical protein
MFGCVLGVILSVQLLYAFDENVPTTNSTVVASVEGIPIYQHEIDVRPDDIEAFVAGRELDMLDARIMQTIEDHAIQAIGIKATEDEVRSEVDSKFEQSGLDDAQARKIADMYRTLVVGLEKWHKNRTQSVKIYEEDLAEFMTQAQWHQWQKSCPSSKDLVKIKKQIPKGIDDMKKNSLQSSKRDILRSKLVDHVTAGVCVKEDEIRVLYTDKYRGNSDKPDLSTVQDNLRAEILKRKKQETMTEWRKTRFRQASIQIKNKRIKELWKKRHRSLLLTTEPQNPVVTLPGTEGNP